MAVTGLVKRAGGGKKWLQSCVGVLLALSAACAMAASERSEYLTERFQGLAMEAYGRLATESKHCDPGPEVLLSVPGSPDDLAPEQLGCLLHTLDREQGLDNLQAVGSLLLERELPRAVQALLQRADVQRRRDLRTQLVFQLGQYLFERGNWQQARSLMAPLESRFSLSGEQRQYLKLTEALELQRQGEHRKALILYERFEPEHAYYPEARTNLAAAYLRQDWWTDAHREIDALLAQPLQAEYKNRLRILLGLSQLQQGFYRDARKTVRRVEQGSRYAAHGWRAIGLAALHQEDYGGALNAFRYLKEHNNPALPEGSFLVAFSYDQMNNLPLAEASYTEAMLDYQNRINQVERISERLTREDWLPEISPLARPQPSTLGSNNAASIRALERQYQELNELRDAMPPHQTFEDIRRRLGVLLTEYRNTLGDHYHRHLELRRETLQSYLSQSQYGLATTSDRQ